MLEAQQTNVQPITVSDMVTAIAVTVAGITELVVVGYANIHKL